MVKVRLVENSVKRKVGMVMVVKVMSQYRIPGMTLMRKSIILPNVPIHELPTCESADSRAIPNISADDIAGVAELVELTELWTTEETVSMILKWMLCVAPAGVQGISTFWWLNCHSKHLVPKLRSSRNNKYIICDRSWFLKLG